MTKLLRLAGLLILLTFSAQLALAQPTQTPITGHFGGVGPDPENPSIYQVQFALAYCGGNIPMVQGYGTIPSTTATYTADSTGLVSGSIWANDLITCGATTGGTRYNVTYLLNGQRAGPVICYNVLSTQGTFNFDQAVQCPQVPPPTPPPPPFPDAGFHNVTIYGNLLAGSETVYGAFGAESTNGLVNPTLFPGADLGAQFNAATSSCSDAAPCHVVIPPGNYTFATNILLPRRTNGLWVTCDRNASLTFTGHGDAFGTQTSVNAGGNNAGTLLDGGCALHGTSAATSGVHFRPGQGYMLLNWEISGFTAGDGIWVDGANMVWLQYNSSTANLNGLHVTGNTCNGANQCTWDRPNLPGTWVNSGAPSISGFAANAVKATMNRFSNNLHWGILDGDVVGGSVTKSFNNNYSDNVLEGNGTGAPFGAALIGFSRAATFARNYMEGNQGGLVLGCVNGSPSGVAPQTGYTSQFCGTADKTDVDGNFENDPSTVSETLLNFADSPAVEYNTVNGNSQCLVDNSVSSGLITIHGNMVYGSGAYTCQNGTPGGTLVNYRFEGDSSGAVVGMHFYGTTQVDGLFSTGTLAKLNTGNPTQTAGDVIVATIGSLVIHQSTVTPGGACGTPNTTNIWICPAGMYICNGNSTWKPISTP
jgi:hypothetical protein